MPVRLAAAVVGAAALLLAAGPVGPQGDARAQDEAFRVYLPLVLRGISVEDLPPAATAEPAATRAPTGTATPTWTPVTIPPTLTPLPTFTPEPTDPPMPASVHGRIVFDGRPLDAGYGQVGGPQIELRRCDDISGEPCPLADWHTIARTETVADGAFAFGNALPLEEGQAYQVWWVNDDNEEVQGDSRFLHRWWSLPIETLEPGDDVDVGTFDVTDLKYKSICHDCLQSLPIEFEWTARSNRSEKYQWSLFRGCGDVRNREGAWRTRSLGHARSYTLEAPPPGFRLNEKYCWYVFIDDGDNGTGWPFFEWRVTFLPTP